MKNIEYKIIELTKKDFPEKLRNIKNSPKKLYAIGNLDLLFKDSFAIIGTRKVSKYGIKNCKYFSKEIALRDIPIVSGMAIGVDGIAHNMALECNSETIAVLGSGFDNIYPKENKYLFDKIIEKNGLVITEYDFETKPISSNFPKRNRLVSALSEGILVIEAAYRSGTSITVNYAKEQGKKVFALPGRLDDCHGRGVNRLIKEGAILTENINDILENYPQFINKKRKTISKNLKNCGKVNEKYKDIYSILKKDVMTIEEISYKLKNKDIREIVNTLLEMELDEIIINEIGVGYKLKES